MASPIPILKAGHCPAHHPARRGIRNQLPRTSIGPSSPGDPAWRTANGRRSRPRRAIIGQQISLAAAISVHRQLQRLLGATEKPGEDFTRAWLAEFSPCRALVAAHLWSIPEEIHPADT
ncbi:MAG: hypothetical protein IPH23_03900 [Gammaproteobacteria bacterium]|nr:hypothetical protein [Gammaproteobacteria bacterium]